MPQLRWEGGKGAQLRGKVNAESSSEVLARIADVVVVPTWDEAMLDRLGCGQT